MTVENAIQIKSGINNSCKNGKYLASIIDDSVTTCDKVMEETKTIPKNFNEKKATCKTKNFYISFLSITFTLLTAIAIYCYLIKYQAKQNHL